MKNLLIIFAFIHFFSCQKEKCISAIQENVVNRTFYDEFYCGNNESFERVYYDKHENVNDFSCQTYNSIPTDIDFKGIIVAIGVKVEFATFNNSSYENQLTIIEDLCEKKLDIKFSLLNNDTTEVFIHNRNALIFLEGYDESYEVNLSHEIIPFEG